ncbi:MAG: hypothetical protein PVJ67_03175 [Candidatus Pacearchaeota archaeon]|jgi:hypothetical protein
MNSLENMNERDAFLKILDETRKPGDTLLKKIDYYFIPFSLIRREKRWVDLRRMGVKEGIIYNLNEEQVKKRKDQITQSKIIETIRCIDYMTMIYFLFCL